KMAQVAKIFESLSGRSRDREREIGRVSFGLNNLEGVPKSVKRTATRTARAAWPGICVAGIIDDSWSYPAGRASSRTAETNRVGPAPKNSGCRLATTNATSPSSPGRYDYNYRHSDTPLGGCLLGAPTARLKKAVIRRYVRTGRAALHVEGDTEAIFL